MIHPTAIVDPKAELGRNVIIGPYCCVGPHVILRDGCVLRQMVVIEGHTECGEDNVFHPGCVIGGPPQDIKYKGGDTRLIIGRSNIFREGVTVHVGTEVGGGETRIGSHNHFMVGTHIAHDVHIGNHCILANCVHLAGHVHLEDKVTIGGLVGVHHFTTIGLLAFIGGQSRITQDVPPFMSVVGMDNRVRGFNKVGMLRWGYTAEQIQSVREAYRKLFGERGENGEGPQLPLAERLAELERRPDLNGEVRAICEALRRRESSPKGRWREQQRTDTDADRASFYRPTSE